MTRRARVIPHLRPVPILLVAALSVVLAGACAGTPEPDGAGETVGSPALRVMTFNIRYGSADDGPDSWPDRRSHVVRTVRDHAPHVLGVQEALRFQLDALAAAFPGMGEVATGCWCRRSGRCWTRRSCETGRGEGISRTTSR